MLKPITKAILQSLLCCSLLIGCHRNEQLGVVANAPAPDLPDTVPQTMDLRPLSQITPNLPTHLAADTLGNIYWVQETPERQDILFVAGHDEIPHPTSLTSDAIITAFGPAPPPTSKPGSPPPLPASGNIESIAIDWDNNVLFFFNGGIGRSTRICLGRFNPLNQSIQILADAQGLASAARMGDSIQLARGQIIKPFSGPTDQPARYWLWLHQPDAALFLQFDPRASGWGQSIELTRAFDQLSGNPGPPSLASDLLEFSAGSDQTLWMVDWHAARLWRVDETGAATPWITLLGLPRDLSEITPRPHGIAIAFAPTGDPAVGTPGDGQSMKDAHVLSEPYPLLLAIQQDRVIPIVLSSDIQVPILDVTKLRLRSLLPTSSPHRWIAYDAASGMLMRLKLQPKQN